MKHPQPGRWERTGPVGTERGEGGRRSYGAETYFLTLFIYYGSQMTIIIVATPPPHLK